MYKINGRRKCYICRGIILSIQYGHAGLRTGYCIWIAYTSLKRKSVLYDMKEMTSLTQIHDAIQTFIWKKFLVRKDQSNQWSFKHGLLIYPVLTLIWNFGKSVLIIIMWMDALSQI